ncbi:MAG: CDP-alcohol phosphatidyltransferase family protein [Deferrisomatales bacterium]
MESAHGNRVWTLPNALTFLRLCLAPAVVWLLADHRHGAAVGVFAAAGLTDALDGFAARRLGQTSRLGAVLDPVADKALILSSVVVLGLQGEVPSWLAAAIVVRDAVIVVGALAYRAVTGSLEMAPTLLSKANTAAQVCLVLATLVREAGLAGLPWLPGLHAAVGVTTVGSGLHYVAVWSGRALAGGPRG